MKLLLCLSFLFLASCNSAPEETYTVAASYLPKHMGRVRDIANLLLAEHRRLSPHVYSVANDQNEQPHVQMLTVFLEEIVTESRMQYRSRLNLDIEHVSGAQGYGLFSDQP